MSTAISLPSVRTRYNFRRTCFSGHKTEQLLGISQVENNGANA